MKQATISGKLIIQATLKLLTGMHIGASDDFAPIGSVDKVFIRDPFTKQPIVPGSTQKGKMRTLLAKIRTEGLYLQGLDKDDDVLKRLFGIAGKNDVKPARLQFCDAFMSAASLKKMQTLDLDTYIGEIKYENTIDRLTATANPRQIERVPAGTEFDFKLVYNIEDPKELLEDMDTLADGFALLQLDYLGGHGSRGYGRVCFENFKVEHFSIGATEALDVEKIAEKFKRS